MEIEPFATETYFALYEFSAPHLLAASDCEAISSRELLERAGADVGDVLDLKLSYSDSAGEPSLREAIAAREEGLAADDIVVVNAPEEGIYLTMRALLEPGDSVVVLRPSYDSLANVARHIGARVHDWPLRATASGWELDVARLDELLERERPALVVVNFPHNPTGYLPTADVFADLTARVTEAGARLFCDEMYRGLEREPSSRLASAASLSANAVSLGGLSKSHGLPGLRVGWLSVRDDDVRRRLIEWKHYTTICAPVVTSALARAALACGDGLMREHRQRIEKNLDLAKEFFASRDGFTLRPPTAGSIALLETPWDDAEAACHRLAKRHGVVLLPGACLGADARFVRIGLGRDGFARGLAALDEALTAERLG